MYLAPIRLLYEGMYLAPIISQHLDIVHMLCAKNDINQKFWDQLISVMVCGFRKSLVD